MSCLDFNSFSRYIMELDESVQIDDNKPLRYDVWQTNQKHVADLTKNLSTKGLPNPEESARLLVKLKNALRRAKENDSDTGSIQKDVFEDESNIEFSIALHEVMESIKGEADKARNNGISISEISAGKNVLPSLPMNRIAASIGRKIAFQKGYRFKRPTSAQSAQEIEQLYYTIGAVAVEMLQKRGYLKTDVDTAVIRDWMDPKDLKKDFPKGVNVATPGFRSVSLVEKKFNITKGSEEAKYFLNRTNADISDTSLGLTTEKLSAVNMIVQPSTYVIPDSKETRKDGKLQTKEELARWDDGMDPDPIMEDVRKDLYDTPLRVNTSMMGLLDSLFEDTENTGKTASKRILETFGHRKKLIASLFGLKRSDDFSIDKKESVSGQNLSKTTPIDDLVEYLDLLRGDLHMPMKIGRNGRLYYLNSVLNAHGSKQMRALLTPGPYTVATGSADMDYLVYQVAQALNHTTPQKEKVEYTYDDITSGDKLGPALEAYSVFVKAGTFRKKMQSMAQIGKLLPGVDFVTAITALQAVQDIRSPTKGQITTEFAVASDATASGGTLTFLQAMGTNMDVNRLMQRIGILKPDGLVLPELKDIYGILQEAMERRMNEEGGGMPSDIGVEDPVALMKTTLEILFVRQGKNVRDFAKDPTMTFIYGQGRTGAINTMSRNLADTVIDNLDDPLIRDYLAKITNNDEYRKETGDTLRDEQLLYNEITESIKNTGLPGMLFEMMEDNVKGELLADYASHAQRVYDLIKELNLNSEFRILPAGAVLAGIEPTPENLEKYGMPISKATWIHQEFKGDPVAEEDIDSVLTRSEKLTPTVMNVSTVHGIDSALMYHSMNKLENSQGMVAIHDEVRGTVKDVRAMEKAYTETAKQVALQYDMHEQVMKAIAAYDPELAQSSEFKSLMKEISEDVDERKKLVENQWNDNTSAFIGDKKFEDFAKERTAKTEAEVDIAPDDTVQSSIPKGEILAEQNFGTAVVIVQDAEGETEVPAQAVWDDIQSRKGMVEELKKCLKT